MEAILIWLSYRWGIEFKCNKLYKIHSKLCFSYYLHHKSTYDYIQYNAVWQAHVFCVEQVVLTGRGDTNISALCLFFFFLSLALC